MDDAAVMDQECASHFRVITRGFPKDKKDLPEDLKKYWGMKDDLYVVENVPHKNRKMLIPHSLRRSVLEGLHAGHQGVTSMMAKTRLWYGT